MDRIGSTLSRKGSLTLSIRNDPWVNPPLHVPIDYKVKQMLALLSESMEPRENKRDGYPAGHWSREIKRCGSTMILTLITAGQLKGRPDPHPLQPYAQPLPMTLALPLRVRPFFSFQTP